MLKKLLIVLVLAGLSLNPCVAEKEIPKVNYDNAYAPTLEEMAKEDFLKGWYISEYDPNLHKMIELRMDATPYNTNKYLYYIYLGAFKVHVSYAYKYNDMMAFDKYRPRYKIKEKPKIEEEEITWDEFSWKEFFKELICILIEGFKMIVNNLKSVFEEI